MVILTHGPLGDFRKVIFKLTVVNGGWGISYEIALRWMPLDLTDDKSTLVQVMAWCRQATSHYLNQCWPRSLSPNGVTRPQWVKICHQQNMSLRYSLYHRKLPRKCWRFFASFPWRLSERWSRVSQKWWMMPITTLWPRNCGQWEKKKRKKIQLMCWFFFKENQMLEAFMSFLST